MPYQYNRDGRVKRLGQLKPDFINLDAKCIIEVFGSHWHKEGSDIIRIERLKKLGYKCLVFWDYDLEKLSREEIVDRIRVFQS